MSMFNFDGAIVAGVISDQHAANTFINILETRRDAKRAGGPTEQDYVNLLNAYNQLVARFNRVIESDKIENEKNRQIDLRHAEAIAARDARIAQMQKDFHDIQAYWLEAANEAYNFRILLSVANRRLSEAGLEEVKES